MSTLDDRSKERMSPNDQVYYTVSDGLVLIRNSAQANVDSWTTGDLRFDNKTLKEMAKVIERRYDVKSGLWIVRWLKNISLAILGKT